MLRYFRSYFFGPPGNANKKFSTGNKPDESIFKKLFNSVLFSQESADTATTAAAGHVKIATDANVKIRSDANTDGHNRVVEPHQLPNLEAFDGTEASTIGVPVQKGGLIISPVNKAVADGERKNFRLEVVGNDSIVVDPGANGIALDGDEAAPTNDKFYGRHAGSKGWYFPIPDYSAIVVPNVLQAEAGALSWVLPSSLYGAPYQLLHNSITSSNVPVGTSVIKQYTLLMGTVTSVKSLVKCTVWFEFVDSHLNDNYVYLWTDNGMVGFTGAQINDGSATGLARIELELNFGGMGGSNAIQSYTAYHHSIPNNIIIGRQVNNPQNPTTHNITFYVTGHIDAAGSGGDIVIHQMTVEFFNT